MDSIQAPGVGFSADTINLANDHAENKKKNGGTSEYKKTSDRQDLRHYPIWKNNTAEIKERKKEEDERKKADRVTPHLPLYKAARAGDWETASKIFKENPSAMTANITTKSHTVLHIAITSGDRAIQFVKNLLDLDPKTILPQADDDGNTPLALAAGIGNTEVAKLLVEKNGIGKTEVAKLLVEKNGNVLTRRNRYNDTPLHLAAKFGHKETARYLFGVINKEEPALLTGESGALLLKHFISADLYGMALYLLNQSPDLALKIALETLAEKPQAFESGSHFGFWKRIIYNCLPVVMDNFPSEDGDVVNSPPNSSGKPSTNSRNGTLDTEVHVMLWSTIKKQGLPRVKKDGDEENPTVNPSEEASTNSRYHRFLQQISCIFGTLVTEVNVMLWSTIEKLVPGINRIHDAKLMHKQTRELVKLMCSKVTSSTKANAFELLRRPLFTATKLGIHEFVTEIIKTYPHLTWYRDEDNHNVFSLAVLHHHESIFSLIHQIGLHKQFVVATKVKFGNNILHLAGKLQPSTRVSGAALQMQRELQWFKEIEKIVDTTYREMKNSDQKTPRTVFTEEHQKLVKQGEEWMKGAASSCTLVASLVLTVVFAAAFTVPGGNNGDQGIPIYLHAPSFMIFALSDAIALFSSSTSLLMFLGILTSRYSEDDFLISLPLKLIIGLLTLFFSITSMVVAFGAAFYIVLFHRFNLVVVIIPIAFLAFFPVTSFAIMQIPLLYEICQSTFGHSILHNPSKEIMG